MDSRMLAAAGALTVALAVLAGPTSLAAQDVTIGEVPPVRVVALTGAASVHRDESVEPALPNLPLLPGDRLEVTNGRLALQWPDGVTVAGDRLMQAVLEEGRTLRVERGLTVVLAPTSIDSRGLVIAAPNASLTVDRPGLFTLEVREPGGPAVVTRVEASAGDAWIEAGGRQVAFATAQQVVVRGAGVPVFEASDMMDEGLMTWARAVVDPALDGPATSASYLPLDLAVYGRTLDRHGAWEYDADAGYVWYPKVAPEWRPYSTGVWVQAGRYGWAWAGTETWSWPTHHYGHWSLGRQGRWYWRPGSDWSPARVSWAIGPGYVAWCPLAPNGRPAVRAPFGAARSESDDATLHARRGWTTMSARDFRARLAVERAAVDVRRLAPAELAAFAQQTSSPAASGGRLTAFRPATRPPMTPTAPAPDPAPAATRWPSSPQAWPSPAPSAPAPTVYAPAWPWFGGYVANGYAYRQSQAPDPVPYTRPTPFIDPRWTNRPGKPFTAGLPQIPDRPVAPVVEAPPAEGNGGAREGGHRHGGSARVKPPARPPR